MLDRAEASCRGQVLSKPLFHKQKAHPRSSTLARSSRTHSSQKTGGRPGGSQRSGLIPISGAVLGKSLNAMSLSFSICEVGKVWDLIVGAGATLLAGEGAEQGRGGGMHGRTGCWETCTAPGAMPGPGSRAVSEGRLTGWARGSEGAAGWD